MVGAVVVLPRLNVQFWVNFLIDTGAGCTCLHLGDTGTQGIDYAALTGLEDMGGIGSARYAREAGGLIFLDANSQSVLEPLPRIMIGMPRRSPDAAPSLLGRDILSRYQFTLDIASNIVVLL